MSIFKLSDTLTALYFLNCVNLLNEVGQLIISVNVNAMQFLWHNLQKLKIVL